MSKKSTPEAYSEPWRWGLPRLHVTKPLFHLKPVVLFLFGGWAKNIRRLSFIVFILMYVPVLTALHMGSDALTPIPDEVSAVTDPVTIQGEKDQFLVAHIYNNVYFRVIGANKYWRIFHECQNHVVVDLSGNLVRTECQHPDNWVTTSENEWHHYTLRYEESIRVIYSPGAKIELRVVAEGSDLTPFTLSLYRFVYAILFCVGYITLNIDSIPTRYLNKDSK